MPTHLDRLRDLFNSPWARTAARATPLWLVATASGAVIGAALAEPAFATSPFGTLGVSLAANMLTSMAYDLLKPDLDDDTRADQIQQALEARDPATGALVAAALLDAGPDVVQALPTNNREVLIDGLTKGMEQAGGPLAQIAARYAAGLRDPQIDWAALQATLRQVVEQTAMTIQVGNKGQIRDVAMEVEGVGGNVEMNMTAGDEGIISGARMSRSAGRAPMVAATRQCPDCGAPITTTQATCARCGVKLGPAA